MWKRLGAPGFCRTSKTAARGLRRSGKKQGGSQGRQNVGEDRKLGKIFKFLMASIISWNTFPIFYAVLKDSGDHAWEVCWRCTLPRQVLLWPSLVPEQPFLCHGRGWDRRDSRGNSGCSRCPGAGWLGTGALRHEHGAHEGSTKCHLQGRDRSCWDGTRAPLAPAPGAALGRAAPTWAPGVRTRNNRV